MDFIELAGQPASELVREELAQVDKPVLLAFSGGKDALAAWLALRESGVDVIPYYMYYVPGLSFVEEHLALCERWFGYKIHRYPHPSLYRWLNNLVFQAPENCGVIEAAGLPSPSHEVLVSAIREDLGLPADTWVADGVRAADSIVRRTSLATHGVQKMKNHKVSVIWDWRKAHVMDKLDAVGIELPKDYEWFGRSFDGLDFRFLEPLSRFAPDDFERILEWFPLADIEIFRRNHRKDI